MPFTLLRPRQVGLLCLLVTVVGWGLNWPVMKFLATASTGTLLTPLVGVVTAAIALSEPLGAVEVLALILTLDGVSLAIHQRV